MPYFLHRPFPWLGQRPRLTIGMIRVAGFGTGVYSLLQKTEIHRILAYRFHKLGQMTSRQSHSSRDRLKNCFHRVEIAVDLGFRFD